MDIRTKWIPMIVGALLFSGCGGGSKPAEKSSESNGQPKIATKPFSLEVLAYCQQFGALVTASLKESLIHSEEDRTTLLNQAYANLVKNADKDYGLKTPAFDKVSPKFIDLPTTCATIGELGKLLETTEDAKKENANAIDIFGWATRWFLRYFVKTLDLNSSYISPSSLALSDWEHGHGAGLILMERTDYFFGRVPNYLVVRGYYPLSKNKGLLKSGTKIFKINGKSIKAFKEFQDADEELNIKRSLKPNEILPKKITVTIDGVEGSDVDLELGEFDRVETYSYTLDPAKQFLYIKLKWFENSAPLDILGSWFDAVQENIEQGGRGLKGLVIDFRGNGGGYLEHARAILTKLLPKRATICWKVPKGEAPIPIEIDPQGNARGVPALVILVDRRSASSTEIVTAAVRDYGRGLIVGEPTFGKGVGQRVHPVNDPIGGELATTNFYFFSPAGISNQVSSIQPDIERSDPVLDWLKNQPDSKPMRMSDYASLPEFHDRVIPRPDDSVKVNPDFERDPELEYVTPDDLSATKEAVKKYPVPTTCEKMTDPSKIEEEKDCLIDTAYNVVRALANVKGSKD